VAAHRLGRLVVLLAVDAVDRVFKPLLDEAERLEGVGRGLGDLQDIGNFFDDSDLRRLGSSL